MPARDSKKRSKFSAQQFRGKHKTTITGGFMFALWIKQ